MTSDPLLPLAAFALCLAAVWLRALVRAARGALTVGIGYKAKALCSALFVSGLELDLERAPEIADEAYRAMRLFRARADRKAASVTVSLFGLCARTAAARPGWGATLAIGPVTKLPHAAPPPPTDGAALWPDGEAAAPEAAPALARVLTDALRDDGPKLRRTRALVVVRAGRLLAERYAPGFAAATPLNGWSMTKSAFGALLGTLVGEGRVAPSSRALLAQWREPGDPRAQIALEDLLRMRSGLNFSEVYSDLNADVNRMLFVSGDAGGYAAARPLAHPPGTRWQYASGTSNILSLIARRALGDRDYWSWPRRALFAPIGMASAVLEPDASGTFVASSYLFATARDWARLGELMRRDGVWGGRRVLPEGWVKFLTTPTPQSPDGRYGAHWWLKLSKELGGETPAAAKIPADAFHALGHEGQCLTVIPSRELVVVRLGLSIDITAWDHAAFLADLLAAL